MHRYLGAEALKGVAGFYYLLKGLSFIMRKALVYELLSPIDFNDYLLESVAGSA
jgi:hypothetical protein